MKNKKKTVLHIISTLKRGGTERYLINLIDKTSAGYNNIVLYYYGDNAWEKELSSNSVKVYKCNSEKIFKNLRRIFMIRRIIKQNNVDIVYSYTYYNSVFTLLAARSVKKRIVHSHRVGWDTKLAKIKTYIARFIITLLATDRLACSDAAGKSLFVNNKYTVINNGFDVDAFKYNESTRRSIRKQLGIKNNCLLIGGIGWINKNKNQKFMIEILAELLRRNKKSKLLLIGEADEDELSMLKKICIKNELTDRVIFMDGIKNINDYYSALDILLVTSYNESFSFVTIEGQANGVPIVASEAISPRIKHNKNLHIMKLENGVSAWADSVLSIYGKRVIPDEQISRYSIPVMAESVVRVYESTPSKSKRSEGMK